MRRILLFTICTALAVAWQPVQAQLEAPPPNPTAEARADQVGVEPLTQGPIHEAFANPADLDPTPGPVVPKQPPAEVTEQPPEFMPEGAVWIPGYWSWDDDRDDYVWITGVARVPPPSQRWLPGYWTESDGGWQRVSGFWVSDRVEEVAYRPVAPPDSLEAGPSSPAPSESHFWIPGAWNYRDTDYVWQAGYWAPYRPNWVWVPARWVWTPSGFVFLPGYWDHSLAYRGQMFAPIYFSSPVYLQPAFVYRPWCVIATNNLFIHLWVRPRWGCYYFGNYYGSQFANRGFVPWANVGNAGGVARHKYVYDPFHAYARVHYRQQGVDYIGRVQGWHRYYAEHEDVRPPRTFQEQRQRPVGRGAPAMQTQLLASSIQEIAKKTDAPIRLTKIEPDALKRQTEHAAQLRNLHVERSRMERAAAQTIPRIPGVGEPADRGREAGDRGRDAGKDRPNSDKGPGPLVDRVDRPDRGTKNGQSPKADTAQGGERRGPRLSLPKVDLPVTATTGAATRPGAGPAGGSPPPQPTPAGRTTSDRGSKSGGDAKGADTAKGGATTRPGIPPGATVTPPFIERSTGPRAGTAPPTKTGQQPAAGTSPGDRPGRPGGIPNVERPGSGGLPKNDLPGRSNPPNRGPRTDAGPPTVTPGTNLPANPLPTGRPTPPGVVPPASTAPGNRPALPRGGGATDLPGRPGGAPTSPGAGSSTTIPPGVTGPGGRLNVPGNLPGAGSAQPGAPRRSDGPTLPQIVPQPTNSPPPRGNSPRETGNPPTLNPPRINQSQNRGNTANSGNPANIGNNVNRGNAGKSPGTNQPPRNDKKGN